MLLSEDQLRSLQAMQSRMHWRCKGYVLYFERVLDEAVQASGLHTVCSVPFTVCCHNPAHNMACTQYALSVMGLFPHCHDAPLACCALECFCCSYLSQA